MIDCHYYSGQASPCNAHFLLQYHKAFKQLTEAHQIRDPPLSSHSI